MFTETLHLNFQDLKYRFRNKSLRFFSMVEQSLVEKGHVKAFNSSRDNILKTLRELSPSFILYLRLISQEIEKIYRREIIS